MQRQDLVAWALDEYKATGRSAADVDEMALLFNSHFTEAIKQCVLGTPLVDAHRAVCAKCEELGAGSPAPLSANVIRAAKRQPAAAADKK